MPTERIPGKPSTRRYTPAEKEQAVRLVRTLRAELGTEHGTIQVVAAQLGYGVESVRSWVRQADIDDGQKPGVTTAGAQRIKTHEQRNVLAKVPTHAQADVKGDYWAIFDPIEGEGPKALAEGRRRSHPALHREVEAALPLRRRLRGGEPRGVARLPGLLHRAPQAHPALQPHRADLRGDPTPSEGDRPPPGEQSCLSLFWAVLDRASKGWQALTMSLKAFRLLQNLRSQLLEAASCSPTWARR
jgi:transposase-like protein